MANEQDGGRLRELLTAAHRGDITRVGELHAAGADLDECDGEGWSALIEAAKGGQLEMTRELLRRGAKPNPAQVAHTALRGAAIFGHGDIVEVLLRSGADANGVSLHGRTPLMGAAMKGHVLVAKTLLSAGANLSAVNSHGETAMDVAKGAGHAQVVEMLAAAELVHAIDSCEDSTALFAKWEAAGIPATALNVAVGGRTPLDAAVARQDAPLAAQLIAQGATRG